MDSDSFRSPTLIAIVVVVFRRRCLGARTSYSNMACGRVKWSSNPRHTSGILVLVPAQRILNLSLFVDYHFGFGWRTYSRDQ
jgi:hypothetical protein